MTEFGGQKGGTLTQQDWILVMEKDTRVLLSEARMGTLRKSTGLDTVTPSLRNCDKGTEPVVASVRSVGRQEIGSFPLRDYTASSHLVPEA